MNPLNSEQGLQKAYAELQEAAALLMAQYEIEEEEHGFPFNFGLRDAHRKMLAVLRSHAGHGTSRRKPPTTVMPDE